MANFEDSLKNHLNSFNTAPYLFVGSGISQRYLGLDTWQDLLRSISSRLDLKDLEFYHSKSSGNLPEVATLMANDFHDVWWSNSDFSESRKNFKKYALEKSSPIKYEISKYIEDKSETNEQFKEELDALKKVNIDGIITTNWDLLLDEIFPDYKIFIGQDKLIFSEAFFLGDIYKIHGSINEPNSLILTKEDYEDFNKRNAYLASKLLTLFVEQPIIFLGYSLSDENIREILKSIINCLTEENISKLQDRLLFCEWHQGLEEPKFEDGTIMLEDTVLPIKLIKLDSFLPLYEILGSIKNRMPIKVLKNMKKMIYNFVKSTEPNENIFVTDDINVIEENNAEFVYGVGLKDRLTHKGLVGLSQRDLLEDLIDDQNWNAFQICKEVFPEITGNVKYIPYFKYLSEANILDNGLIPEENNLLSEDLRNELNNIDNSNFYPNGTYLNKMDEIRDTYDNISSIIDDYDFQHACMYITLIDPSLIDTTLLREFCSDNLSNENLNNHSFKKLLCLLDYLENKYPYLDQ